MFAAHSTGLYYRACRHVSTSTPGVGDVTRDRKTFSFSGEQMWNNIEQEGTRDDLMISNMSPGRLAVAKATWAVSWILDNSV